VQGRRVWIGGRGRAKEGREGSGIAVPSTIGVDAHAPALLVG